MVTPDVVCLEGRRGSKGSLGAEREYLQDLGGLMLEPCKGHITNPRALALAGSAQIEVAL